MDVLESRGAIPGRSRVSHLRRGRLVLLSVFSALVIGSSDNAARAESLAASGEIQTVVLSDPFTHRGFRNPVLNDVGDVTFQDGDSIWTTAGGLRQIMTVGDNAVGFPPDGVFSDYIDIRSPISASQGRSAFQAYARLSGESDERLDGIWTETSERGLQLVAGAGKPVPGATNGEVFGGFGSPAIAGDGGHVGFWAAVHDAEQSTGNKAGLWMESEPGGELRTIARGGGATPGIADATFDDFFSFPALNSLGQAAFVSRLSGGGHHYGVWTEGGDEGLRLIAFENDMPAALPAGTRIGQASSNRIRINDNGDTAFAVTLTGEGVTTDYDEAILVESSGDGIRLVARMGDAAPGLGTDVRLSYLGFSALNMAGQVAFPAALTGPGVNDDNDTAIFSEAGGEGLRLIARHGDSAPGVENAKFGLFGANWGIHFNDRGQTVFSAFYDSENATSQSKEGFWIERRPGEVVPMLLEGDVIEVAPGDERTVSGFRTARFGRVFNDQGQLVVGISFTDHSEGVFVIGGSEATSPVPGDVDFSGRTNAADIDLVCSAVRELSRNPLYDLDGSGEVDASDLGTAGAALFGTYPGDANLDGSVDRADIATIVSNFGNATDARWSTGDFNCDGRISMADLQIVRRHFGESALSSGSAVPEPSALMLILGGMLTCVCVRSTIASKR